MEQQEKLKEFLKELNDALNATKQQLEKIDEELYKIGVEISEATQCREELVKKINDEYVPLNLEHQELVINQECEKYRAETTLVGAATGALIAGPVAAAGAAVTAVTFGAAAPIAAVASGAAFGVGLVIGGGVGGAMGFALGTAMEKMHEILQLDSPEAMKAYYEKNPFESKLLCISSCVVLLGEALAKMGKIVYGQLPDWINNKFEENMSKTDAKFDKRTLKHFLSYVDKFKGQLHENREQVKEFFKAAGCERFLNLSFDVYDAALKITEKLDINEKNKVDLMRMKDRAQKSINYLTAKRSELIDLMHPQPASRAMHSIN